jgi:Skp family chaperone for outer membrane proteins
MKKNIFRFSQVSLVFIFTLVFFVLRSYAMEIPLERQSVEPGARMNIGYVDIDKVFKENSMTQRYKEEFQAEVARRKAAIDALQGCLDNMQRVIIASSTVIGQLKGQVELKKKLIAINSEQIASTNQLLKGATAQAATTVPAPQAKDADPASLEADIKQQETELEDTKKMCDLKSSELEAALSKNRDELLKLEDKNTSEVLTDIYHVIQKVAEEEDVTIILDKNEVLYGKEVRDLTDKVIERLHGH